MRNFFYFCPILFSLYLLTVGAEGNYCTRSNPVTYTIGRTPLDEESARRRDLYMTTYKFPKRQARFEPAFPAS
jgi:hypothetical protein